MRMSGVFGEEREKDKKKLTNLFLMTWVTGFDLAQKRSTDHYVYKEV